MRDLKGSKEEESEKTRLTREDLQRKLAEQSAADQATWKGDELLDAEGKEKEKREKQQALDQEKEKKEMERLAQEKMQKEAERLAEEKKQKEAERLAQEERDTE